MISPRLAPSLVAGLIIVVTIVSGPAGFVNLSEPENVFDDVGSGNATVQVEQAPETLQLRKGVEGQNTYYLEVEPVTVTVHAISGNPSITYHVSIDELGHSANSIAPLRPRGEGTHEISIRREVFSGDRIDKQSYVGQLELVLRSDAGEQVLVERTVPVQVTE